MGYKFSDIYNSFIYLKEYNEHKVELSDYEINTNLMTVLIRNDLNNRLTNLKESIDHLKRDISNYLGNISSLEKDILNRKSKVSKTKELNSKKINNLNKNIEIFKSQIKIKDKLILEQNSKYSEIEK